MAGPARTSPEVLDVDHLTPGPGPVHGPPIWICALGRSSRSEPRPEPGPACPGDPQTSLGSSCPSAEGLWASPSQACDWPGCAIRGQWFPTWLNSLFGVTEWQCGQRLMDRPPCPPPVAFVHVYSVLLHRALGRRGPTAEGHLKTPQWVVTEGPPSPETGSGLDTHSWPKRTDKACHFAQVGGADLDWKARGKRAGRGPHSHSQPPSCPVPWPQRQSWPVPRGCWGERHPHRSQAPVGTSRSPERRRWRVSSPCWPDPVGSRTRGVRGDLHWRGHPGESERGPRLGAGSASALGRSPRRQGPARAPPQPLCRKVWCGHHRGPLESP